MQVSGIERSRGFRRFAVDSTALATQVATPAAPRTSDGLLDIAATHCQSLLMPSPRNRSERIGTPSLGTIAEWWSDPARRTEAESLFPDLAAWTIGWGEPFCFACRWLAPVKDGPRAWFDPAANGWLERAHLKDFSLGGSNEPENIAPLCHLCHAAMPSFENRALAAAWVRDQDATVPEPHLWQAWTDAFAGPKRQGVSRQTRIYRLKAEFCELLLQLKDAPPAEVRGAMWRLIAAAAQKPTQGAPE